MGNTINEHNAGIVIEDYPHPRGEHPTTQCFSPVSSGLPPPAWGNRMVSTLRLSGLAYTSRAGGRIDFAAHTFYKTTSDTDFSRNFPPNLLFVYKKEECHLASLSLIFSYSVSTFVTSWRRTRRSNIRRGLLHPILRSPQPTLPRFRSLHEIPQGGG